MSMQQALELQLTALPNLGQGRQGLLAPEELCRGLQLSHRAVL